VSGLSNFYPRTVRSYYGGLLAMAAQDRLLFVADAIKSNGQGAVYVYHLHNSSEYVAGFETTVAVNTGQTYDFVGSLVKSTAVGRPRRRFRARAL
jgi:hypothetical protein